MKVSLVYPVASVGAERLAAGNALVLSAPAGPSVEFAVGEFKAEANVEAFRLASFNGVAPVEPPRRVRVVVQVGEPDLDRCGNDIGGGRFQGWGDSVDDALESIMNLSGSRRTVGRLRMVQDAIRKMNG